MNDRLPPQKLPPVTITVRASSPGAPMFKVEIPNGGRVSQGEALRAAQGLMDASDRSQTSFPTPMRRNRIRRQVERDGQTANNRAECARFQLDTLRSLQRGLRGDLENLILETFRCLLHLEAGLEITDLSAVWATAKAEYDRAEIRAELEEEARP